MTLLQSRKKMWGVAAIRNTASKFITRSDANRPGSFLSPDAYKRPEFANVCVGTLRLWKRQGRRLYPVHVRYLVPTTRIPGKGFPVVSFCLDHPSNWDSEWENFTGRLCLSGTLVIIVELPTFGETTRQQAQTFLKATWLTIATRLGGLAETPVRVSWWGPGNAAPVMEQAARLRLHKYYLPPVEKITRHFKEVAPVQEAVEVELQLLAG